MGQIIGNVLVTFSGSLGSMDSELVIFSNIAVTNIQLTALLESIGLILLSYKISYMWFMWCLF